MSSIRFYERKVQISGKLKFQTAFHIGSGKQTDLTTDMSVLKNRNGTPVLPGSSLKGNFRHFAEKLAGYLDLSACFLDSELSGVKCVGDERYRKEVHEEFHGQNMNTEMKKLNWLRNHTCDICWLFGSPMKASRIFFADGALRVWNGVYGIRDGVCIDRDSETARYGAKFDYEVASEGTVFDIAIELENPEEKELAIVGAVVSEWESGFRLGGFTSRGLGNAVFSEKIVREVDYTNPEQLKDFLLHRRMNETTSLLEDSLERHLLALGGTDA